jgi:hypothetical protein
LGESDAVAESRPHRPEALFRLNRFDVGDEIVHAQFGDVRIALK